MDTKELTTLSEEEKKLIDTYRKGNARKIISLLKEAGLLSEWSQGQYETPE